MHIEDIERWHWAIIGIIVGGLFAFVQTALHDPSDGAAQSCPQPMFEGELLLNASDEGEIQAQRFMLQRGRGRAAAPNKGDLPRIRNLTVFPPDSDGRTWVTGERLVEILPVRLQDPATSDRVLPAEAHYSKFFYNASVPYKPLRNYDGPASPNLTIRDYLARVQQTHPNAGLTFRYAWWWHKPVTISIGAGAGLLLLGGVWPTVLGLLVGAGLGRPPRTEPAYDLTRFGHAPEPAKPSPAAALHDAAELDARLEKMEAELLANLSRSDAILREDPEPEPVRELQAVPAEAPPAPEGPKGDVEFTGEFYPVAHSVSKKTQ